MPSFTKIVSTALVGFAAFATLASAVDQAEFGNKVRALREGDNLPRHIVHDMHQKVRMARALRGPARMDDEKRAVAEPVIEERAVAAPVPVEERSLSVPMEERGLGHPNFVKRWLFGLFGPPPPPVVAAVVAAKVQAIKQTLTFLNDAFHCKRSDCYCLPSRLRWKWYSRMCEWRLPDYLSSRTKFGFSKPQGRTSTMQVDSADPPSVVPCIFHSKSFIDHSVASSSLSTSVAFFFAFLAVPKPPHRRTCEQLLKLGI
ncbi:hypothetical protein T439DRAFT_154088 [Meredithblackwellia eburnea MCA 4105]